MDTAPPPSSQPRSGWRRVGSGVLVALGVLVLAVLSLLMRGGPGFGVGGFFAPRLDAPEPALAAFEERVAGGVEPELARPAPAGGLLLGLRRRFHGSSLAAGQADRKRNGH